MFVIHFLIKFCFFIKSAQKNNDFCQSIIRRNDFYDKIIDLIILLVYFLHLIGLIILQIGKNDDF